MLHVEIQGLCWYEVFNLSQRAAALTASSASVVLIQPQYIKDFYNKTIGRRNGAGLSGESLTLMYSLTVSVFAVGGLLGSLVVGILVSRFGR